MWIRWIRIRNTDFFCNTWYVGLAPVVDDHNTARCERLGGNGMTEQQAPYPGSKNGRMLGISQTKGASETRGRSHRDNFGESFEALPAVESQSWVSFQALDFLIHRAQPMDFLRGGGGGVFVNHFNFRPYFTRGSFLCQFFLYTLMKHIQNIQKNPCQPMDVENLKKSPRTKTLETFAKCLRFPKIKPYPAPGYGFKNL